ncbi:response regulator [Oculatella sp. LEGE 06141]|uniref:response regulator transcription factor n=1 Tax=Oculatella sp. LEGE 06141 TaxID=1828648 RepID=UPI00187F7209|nr:response regulator [Oculatella sp. LEGE 06141]MBE9180057.1 response regulator [Oculatella sp. LEGE 06141]
MKKVLVIEDETQTRDIFLRCLTFEGFCALGAENGSVGIKLAQTHLPDLIVCDVMMPDLDGHRVLTTLRQNSATAAIPLIFLTAKVTMADLRQGMQLGADDYLIKPCTVEQFLSAIAIRLERQEVLKRAYSEEQQPDSDLSEDSSAASSSTIFPDCPKLMPVFEFIEAHYNQTISLSDVAQAVGYSPAYLTSLVQSQTGRTVKRWIIERRMAQARTLLMDTTQSIGTIAEAVGYADVSYFIRLFRQLHSTSPHVWRNSIDSRSINAQAG